MAINSSVFGNGISEAWSNESSDDPLLNVLAPEYSNLSPEQLDVVLEDLLGEEGAEELEYLLEQVEFSFGKVGNFLKKNSGGIIKGAISGATTGAALGPVGIIGGALGGAALGGAQSHLSQQGQRRATAPARSTTPQHIPAGGRSFPPQQPALPVMGAFGANPAAAQLLGLLSHPQTLQALMSMLLGSNGASQIPVANTQVPVSAFASAIRTLADRTASDQNILFPDRGPDTPEYLLDKDGSLLVDPAVPEERTEVLLGLLGQQAQLDAADDVIWAQEREEDLDLLEDYLDLLEAEEEEEELYEYWEEEEDDD